MENSPEPNDEKPVTLSPEEVARVVEVFDTTDVLFRNHGAGRWSIAACEGLPSVVGLGCQEAIDRHAEDAVDTGVLRQLDEDWDAYNARLDARELGMP